MERPNSKPLFLIAAFLYLLAIGLQMNIDPYRQKYFINPEDGNPLADVGHQSAELLGGVLLGFREVAAGLLWVRADEYFHGGQYDKLVPIFYIVTWLDPHQLDVYSTGAWHLAYNLGDQRLIPEGVKFLNHGIKDNPNVWDLYFQQSYMYNNKVRNYRKAVDFARQASMQKGTDSLAAPYYVYNAIAHNLELDGQIPEMFKQWEVNVARSQTEFIDLVMKKAPPAIKQKWTDLHASPTNRDAVQSFIEIPEVVGYLNENQDAKAVVDAMQVQLHNLNTNYLRRDYFRKGAGQPGYKFDWTAQPNPHWVKSGDNQRHLVNTHFDFTARKIGKRRLLISGHLEGADFLHRLKGHQLYTRINVWLRDKDYDQRYNAHAGDFEWQKKNLTTYKKEISFPTEVRPKTDMKESTDFQFILDFSKDPEDMGHTAQELFPFNVDQYELTLTLDPTRQSLLHQDVYGWKGEGLTDDRYLVTDDRGIHIISKTVTLNKKDVL